MRKIVKGLLVSMIFSLGACSIVVPTKDPLMVDPLTTISDHLKFGVTWSKRIVDVLDATSVAVIPAISDTVSYLSDNKGNFLAVSNINGRVLWSKEYNRPITSDLALTKDAIVFGTADAKVVAVARDNGRKLWEVSVSTEMLAAPTYNQKLDLILIRTIDDKVQVLRASTGEVVWNYEKTPPSLVLRKGISALNIADEAFVCGFVSGKVMLFEAKNGVIEWESIIAIPSGDTDLQRMVDVNTVPRLKDDYLYVTTKGGKVVTLNYYTGVTVWERKIKVDEALVVKDLVFVVSTEGLIYGLNTKTGETVWQQDSLQMRSLSSPVIFANKLIVADIMGYLYFINLDSGEVESKVFTSNKPLKKLFVVGDKLFGLNASGVYFAISAD